MGLSWRIVFQLIMFGEPFCTSVLLAGPTGIEPAAYGLRVRRSNLTELRARVFSLGREHGLVDIELAVSCSIPAGFLFCDMSAGLRHGLFNMDYG